MTAAGQDGERLFWAAALANRMSGQSHLGLTAEEVRAGLAAIAGDLDRAAADRTRRECADELQAERDRPMLNPLRIDALIGRWSGRAPAGEEEQR